MDAWQSGFERVVQSGLSRESSRKSISHDQTASSPKADGVEAAYLHPGCFQSTNFPTSTDQSSYHQQAHPSVLLLQDFLHSLPFWYTYLVLQLMQQSQDKNLESDVKPLQHQTDSLTLLNLAQLSYLTWLQMAHCTLRKACSCGCGSGSSQTLSSW